MIRKIELTILDGLFVIIMIQVMIMIITIIKLAVKNTNFEKIRTARDKMTRMPDLSFCGSPPTIRECAVSEYARPGGRSSPEGDPKVTIVIIMIIIIVIIVILIASRLHSRQGARSSGSLFHCLLEAIRL